MAATKPTRTGKGGKSTSGEGNTSGQSDLAAKIKQVNDLVQPQKCWVINGDGRSLELANGVVVDLENRNKAIVILVLRNEQAELLPEGTRDVTEL